MALEKYNAKRDFKRTAEPPGKVARSKSGRRYYIQKHDASHLHFDFRLEHDGVLKSWAVPKGPSMEPGTRRLAMEVEDHPLEYGHFEGTIPEGEYGGGTVMLWDRGYWEPVSDADEGFRRGKITFELKGERLRGLFTLVRSRPDKSGRHMWFLIKNKEARSGKFREPVEEELNSVSTGRGMEEIALAGSRMWHSNKKENADTGREKSKRLSTNGFKAEIRALAAKLAGRRSRKSKSARRAHAATAHTEVTPAKYRKIRAPEAAEEPEKAGGIKWPRGLKPELATLVDEAPAGDEWVHEVKFDGYRFITVIKNGKIRCFSRNGKDWTHKIPAVVEALKDLKIKNGILDGEVVAPNEHGHSDFQALQNAFREDRQKDLVYYIFDIINHENKDLRDVELVERKAILGRIFKASDVDRDHVRLSEHVVGGGAKLYDNACRIGLEGIISKRGDSAYAGGRTSDWLKVKCMRRQEMVIVGYTPPGGSRVAFGALLLAVNDNDGRLRYVGKTGTGFNTKILRALKAKLDKIAAKKKPELKDPSGELRREHGVTWVKPKLVGEIKFASFTRDLIVRQAVFQGLREDKKAEEVRFELPRETENVAGRRPEKKGKHIDVESEVGGTLEKYALAGLKISKADKVLFTPDITKGELARYYAGIAKWVMPHLVDRPLAVVRCPDGHDKMCFFQKHETSKTLRAGGSKHIKNGSTREYMYVCDLEGLLALVQQGVLEIHVWGTHTKNLENPDQLVFDLDPDPAVSFDKVIEAALRIRDRLKKIGLKSFVKTTGGKGLHVAAPIKPRYSWEDVRAFTKMFTEALSDEFPDEYVSNMAKSKRAGKIFVDYLRNGRGATAVMPYSTRAKANAPVSTPLSWKELEGLVSADQYTLRNLPARLKKLHRDPWEGFFKIKQDLPDLKKILAAA